jgi:hypothetical protein
MLRQIRTAEPDSLPLVPSCPMRCFTSCDIENASRSFLKQGSSSASSTAQIPAIQAVFTNRQDRLEITSEVGSSGMQFAFSLRTFETLQRRNDRNDRAGPGSWPAISSPTRGQGRKEAAHAKDASR